MPVMLNMLLTKWMGLILWGPGCQLVLQKEGFPGAGAVVAALVTEVAGEEEGIIPAAIVAARAIIQGGVEVIGVASHEGVSGVQIGVAMVVVEAIPEEEDTREVAEASRVVAATHEVAAIHEAAATPEDIPVVATAEAPATTTTTMTSMISRMKSQLRTATLATPLVTSTSPTIQMRSMTSM